MEANKDVNLYPMFGEQEVRHKGQRFLTAS